MDVTSDGEWTAVIEREVGWGIPSAKNESLVDSWTGNANGDIRPRINKRRWAQLTVAPKYRRCWAADGAAVALEADETATRAAKRDAAVRAANMMNEILYYLVLASLSQGREVVGRAF